MSGDEDCVTHGIEKRRCGCLALVQEQAAPTPNGSRPIWDLVVADMQERDAIGREKYGTPLQAGNGRDALVDMYQELLDGVVYCRQAIEERDNAILPGVLPGVGERWRSPGGKVWVWTNKGRFRDDSGAELITYTDSLFADGWRRIPDSLPHREAMAAEIQRLKAREQELLESNREQVELRRVIDRQAMVRQFMRVFGQPISEKPGTLPEDPTPSLHGFVADDLVRFRLRLVVEECFELLEAALSPVWSVRRGECDYDVDRAKALAMSLVDEAPVEIDLPELIDATIDIDYVVEGLRATFGLDSTPLWQLVHESNMAKAGPDGVPRRRESDGKVLKPDDWKAPDLASAIEAQRR